MTEDEEFDELEKDVGEDVEDVEVFGILRDKLEVRPVEAVLFALKLLRSEEK